MTRIKHLIAASLMAIGAALSATAETTEQVAELFGRADAIRDPQISPDGRYLAVICSPEVKQSVCIFDLTGGPSIVVPAIKDIRLLSHYWGNNDTLILDVEFFETVKTSSGNRDYDFHRALAFNVNDKKPVMLMSDNRAYLDTNDLAAILPAQPNKIQVGMTVAEDESNAGSAAARFNSSKNRFAYYVFETDLKSGSSKVVSKQSWNTIGAVSRPDGTIAASVYFEDLGVDNQTLKVNANGKTIFERKGLKFNPLSVWGLDTSGQNIIVFLEESANYGLHRMALADGKLTPIDTGAGDGTVGPIVDPRMGSVVGFGVESNDYKQILEDKKLKSQAAALKGAMAGKDVALESWTDDRSQTVASVSSGAAPMEYFIFEAAKGALSPVGNTAPHLDGRTLGAVERVSYKAADGLDIEALLTLPPGKAKTDGPFPLILLPHGGPEARDVMGFDWWVQAYAAAGYAVLQPNFRGSSGYGTDFLEAGYGEFGGKMVGDVMDGANWAVAQGLAKKGDVCAAGASYGGYSALMLGLKGAANIKCVVAVNAVTNPASLIGEYEMGGFGSSYWERYIGSSAYDKAALGKISPVVRASEYAVPVLLIASREDTTVPFEQSKSFEVAAKAKGKTTLVIVEGEDHYLSSTRARYEVLSKSLAFLNQHLPAK